MSLSAQQPGPNRAAASAGEALLEPLERTAAVLPHHQFAAVQAGVRQQLREGGAANLGGRGGHVGALPPVGPCAVAADAERRLLLDGTLILT